MKNQNPQEILNEILLRMKYDMSKTLTENKVLVEQMSDYYYDQFGNLKLEPVNKTKMPASVLYPNIKNGQYPISVPSSNYELKKWYSNNLLRQSIQNVTPKTQSPVGPPKPLPNFDELNKPKTVESIKVFQNWLDKYYPTWYLGGKLNKGQGYGIFGPNTEKAWNNQMIKTSWNFGGSQKPFNDLLSKYNLKYPALFKNLDSNGKFMSTETYLTRQLAGSPTGEYEAFEEDLKQAKKDLLDIDSDVYKRLFPLKPESPKPNLKFNYPEKQYKDATNLVIPRRYSAEELAQNQEIAQKVALRAERIEYDSLSGIVELPGDAVVEYWTYDDIKDFPSFKKNIIALDNTDVNLFSFFRPDFSKGIKSFKLSREGVELNFKQVVQNYGFNGFGILEGEGKVYYYNKYDFVKKTFWEEDGGTILTAASLALAFLPATWPVLLLQSGLQLADAQRQLDMGDTEGAKLSALFAVIPFMSKAIINVPKSATNSLMSKFKDAKNATDVKNVVQTLTTEELNVLKNIREAGDLSSEIRRVATSKEVKNAITATAKQVPGFAKVMSKRIGFEVGVGSLAMYSRWDNMKAQIVSEMTNRQLLQQTIEILKQKIKNEELQKKIEQFKIDSTNQSTQVIAQGLEDILKEAIKVEEEEKQFMFEQLKTAMSLLKEGDSNLDSKISEDVAKKLENPMNEVGKSLTTKDQTQQNEPNNEIQTVTPTTGKAGKTGKTMTTVNQK